MYILYSVQRMMMTAFWDITPGRLVEVDRRFRGTFCLHYHGDEAVRTSEMSVNFYQITGRSIPEGYHLHTRRRENLK
jgi:hypothetical protein